MRTLVLAHRGDTTSARENTIEAFLLAVERGADGVELDVRRTADGALVVHHDREVPSVGRIAEHSVRELPGSVALLGAVLDVLQDVVVNVEIKHDRDDPAYDPTGSLSHDVVALLHDRGAAERVIVSSFDLATLEAVREADPLLATGLLVPVEADAMRAVEVARDRGLGAVHPFVLAVDVALVRRARAAGLEVNVWTVNAPHDLARMVGLGVDGIITDRVDLALRAVGRPQNGVGTGPSA